MDHNFIILLYSGMMSGISYSVTAALYPNMAFTKGFSETYVGIIFSLYCFGNLIFVPFTNKFIQYFTRFNLLLIAVFLNIFSILLYICLFFIKSSNTFVLISIISRILQGVSIEYIMILVFSLSLITSTPDSSSEDRLGYAELFITIGRILGPLISYLYGENSYLLVYFTILLMKLLEVYLLLFGITLSKSKLNQISNNQEFSFIQHVKRTFQNHIHEKVIHNENDYENLGIYNSHDDIAYKKILGKNKDFSSRKVSDYTFNFDEVMKRQLIKLKEINENVNFYKNENGIMSHNTSFYSIKVDADILINNDEDEVNIEDVGYLFFFKSIFNKLIITTFLACIIDYLCQVFYTPVFTYQMNMKFGFTTEKSSLYLSLFFIIYAIGVKPVVYISQIIPTKFMIALGLFINSFSLIFYSPSSILPQKAYISLFGYFFQSLFAGTICLNSIVDFTESLKANGYNDFFASDFSCALYLLSINMSELIGPLIGGFITEYFSFAITCFIVGIANLIFSLFIFGVNIKRIYKEFVDITNEG